MRVFPVPNDENNKWVSYKEIKTSDFKGKDSLSKVSKKLSPDSI